MAEVVGTAYVRIRALTTGLGKDIKDGVSDGMGGADFDIPDSQKRSMRDNARKAGEQAGDEGGKGFSRRFRDSIKKGMSDNDKDTSKRFKKLINNLKKFKLPGRFWLVALAIPALGGALKLAASYITTLVGQLGYVATAAVGLGAALAGSVAAIGAGILPIVLAFKAETPAMDEFTESIREQADAWLEVGVAAQVGLLPALDQAFTNLGRLRGPMTELAGTMGRIIGNAAEAASELLTSESALESWETVFGASVGVFRSLMDGLVPLIGVLPGFFAATAPLAMQLAESLGTAMENFATFISAGTESGTLTTNLQIWYDRAESIGRSVWNIVEALWEVFRVGADVVAPQFETLESKTQGWVDFLRSAEGQSTLDRIFTNALPVAQEFNGLMGDIIEMIVKPLLGGDTEGVVSFLQSIREDWLPLLQDLADALAENLGPNLEELVSGIIELITAMAESGALGTFTMLLGDLIGMLVDLFEIPGIGEFLGIILTILTVLGLLSGPLGIIVGLATTLMPVIASIAGSLLLATPPLWAVVAVILALIAVVAAIIYIWKNWDKIVAGAKVVWENFVNWIGEAWEAVKEFFGGIGDWIAEAWTAFIDFFEELPAKIGEWIASLPALFLQGMVALSQWIRDAIPKVISFMGELIGKVLGFLLGLPVRIYQVSVKLTQALWEWIKEAVPSAIKWLGEMWFNILKWFKDTVPKIIIEGAKMLYAFHQWINDAIVAIPGKLLEFANKVWDWIREFVKGLPDRFSDAITGFGEFGSKLFQAIGDGLRSGVNTIVGWGKEMLNALKRGIISATPEPLKTLLRNWFGSGITGGSNVLPTAAASTVGVAATAMSAGVRSGGGNLSGALAPAGVTGGGGGASPFSAMGFGVSNLMAAAIPVTVTGPTDQFTSPLSGMAPINLVVTIGETDITDLVDARISSNDRATAQALWVKRR